MSSVAEARARALEIAEKLKAKLHGGQTTATASYPSSVATGSNDSVLGKRPRDESVGPGGSERRRKKIPFPTDADFNFLGLIVGPRGATQKQLEQQSGARILVRGKGASKEGEDGSDEEQHVLILADDDAQLQRAEQLVLELLHDPQKAMSLKEQQLREVALQHSRQDAGNGFGSSSSLYSSAPSALHGSSVGEHSMEMRIPSERVGLVIGKMGETIRQLQQMTGCSIQVAKESLGGDGDRVVTLRGTDEQIVRADEEIRRVISSGGLLSSSSGLRSAASLSSSSHAGVGYGGSSTLTMHIPNIAVGLLIGKSGETIRSMQQKTGAIIQVQRNTEVDPSSSTREVVLSGNDQQVEAARREVDFIVLEKLELESRASRSAMGGSAMGGGLGGDGRDGRDGPVAAGGPAGGGDGRASIVLRVPNVAVGTVIGRGGETIKQLQAMTGARIQIDRNDDMKMEREVTISGSADDVERARLEVEELIRQKTTIGGMVPPPSPYGSAYGRGAPPPGWPPYGPPPGYGYPPYDPYAHAPPPGYPPYYPPPADYPYGQQQPPAEYGQQQQPRGAAPHAAASQAGGHYDTAPARAENGQEQQPAAASAATAATASPSQSSPPAAAAAESAPSSGVTIPTPPTEESAFQAYWAGLSPEQQQEYYRLYYPDMLAQIQQQQQAGQ